MMDKYIILNRKVPRLIKLFIIICVIFLLNVYFFKTQTLTSYYSINSFITIIDNKYVLEVEIPINKLYLITNNNKIIINDQEQGYKIYAINNIKNPEFVSVYLFIDDILSLKEQKLNVKIKEKNRRNVSEIFR